jgi:hypothetical protein
MKVVYVAGPLRAKNAWEMELNIRRAEELALQVWKMGAAAICPHAMNRFYFGALGPMGDQMFLDGDFEIIRRCDAVLFTEDWMDSTGAMLEHKVARKEGITMVYDIEELEAWLNSEEGEKS